MSFPPPPDLYQSPRAYWGNPYSAADSNNNSVDMSTATSNPTVALAGLTTKSTKAVTVVTNAVDASGVIADEYTPIAEDATITDAHIGVEHAVIAAVGAVPAAHNNFTTTPYNNLMSASRRESAGWSVEPSNVNGVNEQHEMWIRQCMKDDWGVQYPHKFQIRVIHHIAFQRDQILYLVAKTGSGKSAIPLRIGSLQTGVTLSMVPLVGLGSNQVNNSRNSTNLIKAYHLDKNRGVDGFALHHRLLSLHPRELGFHFLYASPQSLKEGSFWYKCLFQLALMNLIRVICIDEAHTVAQNGRNFRPKFCSAVTAL